MALDCPAADVLAAFLLGRLPRDEVERLAEHVEHCVTCVSALDGLGAADGLVDALRTPIEPRDDATAVLLDDLMAKMCGLATLSGETHTSNELLVPAEQAGPHTTQEIYQFLEPAQQANEIGRIGGYRVLKVLGIGGMGVVFQAVDPELRRQVALKVLRPRLLDDSSARQRFLREAQATARLAHDHIMPILHIGEGRGVPFLVMPLLEGETLEERLKRDRRLDVGEVLRIGGEIALGLAAAHERGFIHRDIKPSNIWLEVKGEGRDEGREARDEGRENRGETPPTRDDNSPSSPSPLTSRLSPLSPRPRAKILDFGVARALGSDATLTHAGAIVGTPAYMAPEQARGEKLDERCDLFSLGCVLYHMATGEVPFKGATTMATLRALEMVTPKPPHVLNPAVPRALSELIVRLLAKHADDRPSAAHAVTRALDAVHSGLPEKPARRRRRTTMAAFVAVSLLTLIGVCLSLLDWGEHSDQDRQEPAQPAVFTAAVNYHCGLYPRHTCVGDFNGDGRLDLVVANQNSHQVSVLLGKGDGTFADPISSSAGQWFAFSVTPGDLDGDGKLDLVVANQGSHQISVLLGKGDGTFQAPVQYRVASGPSDVAVADFNGDGKLDLVVGTNSGSVSVLLGKGDGSFHEAIPFSAARCTQIAVGDFNRDGKLDLALATTADWNLHVFLGKGDGSFTLAGRYNPLGRADGVVTADFNGDGRLDLALTTAEGLHVFLGKGDGTFAEPVVYRDASLPSGYQTVVSEDFDGDGHPDLAVSHSGRNNTRLFRGKGDGAFHAAQSFIVGKSPMYITAGDFNGDGLADVAVPNFDSNDVSILLAIPVPRASSFGPAIAYAAGREPCAVATADFNRDGQADLVVANRGSDRVSVLLGKGEDVFQTAVGYATGKAPVAIAVADFNRDGCEDIVTANRSSGSVSVLLGKEDGTFHEAVSYPAGKKPLTLAVADLNRDGRADLAVVDDEGRTLAFLLGKGDGTFHAARQFGIDARASCIAVGDFNRDGRLDVAVAHKMQVGNVSLLLGKGDGTFHKTVRYPVGPYPTALLAADFNRDGMLDLVSVNWGQNDLNLLAGKGDGSFRPPVNFPVGHYPLAAALGDFSRDGKLGLAVAISGNALTLVRGDGRGAFRPPVLHHVGAHPAGVAVGHFNRDGRPDVAVADEYGDTVSLLLSQPPSARLWIQPHLDNPSCLAGAPLDFSVAAHDDEGQSDPSYTGTVHFRSSDPKAKLPADYTFVPADKGRQHFHVTFASSGAHRLTVEDHRGRQAAAAATVRALGPADIFLQVGAPASVTAGKPFTITITAEDRYGVLAPWAYDGTIRLSCSDSTALMPAGFTFSSKDGSLYTVDNGVTLRTPGRWTITASDSAGRAQTGSAAVTATAPK